MFPDFFSIAIISFFGAMLPGPDFAMVTKNALLYSRKAGFLTALGIALAISVHMTYCVFGVAVVIAHSLILFHAFKYIGGAYLIYLGIKLFFSEETKNMFTVKNSQRHRMIKNVEAIKQGFLCNLLNPKATLFFLSIFTVVIEPSTPRFVQFVYAMVIVGTSIIWFSLLTVILSHARIKKLLEKVEKYIAKLLGVFLVLFGLLLAFF